MTDHTGRLPGNVPPMKRAGFDARSQRDLEAYLKRLRASLAGIVAQGRITLDGGTSVSVDGTPDIGSVLVWDGSDWVPTPPQEIPGLRIPGPRGPEGERGRMGPPGPAGGSGADGDLALSLLAPAGDVTVTAGYGAYLPDYYEIAAGMSLELGAGSVMEIG